MVQGFVFGQPATRTVLASRIVRDNFDALGTTHEGPTPPLNPQKGMFWLDTAGEPVIFLLKFFDGTSFQIIAQFPFAAPISGIIRVTISPAAKVWTVVHNLGQPAVIVHLFDLSAKEITALEIDLSDIDQAIVNHAAPVAGLAMVVG